MGARRTGRLLAGVLLAAGAHAIGWALSGIVTIALFAGVIRNEPAMLNLFYATGGWGEQWFLPLMLLPIVLALGAIGGVLDGRSAAAPGPDYQSAYFVPSSAVPSDPLFTSYTPGAAVGLFGSGSLGTVCQVLELIVNGSSGSFRR